MPAKLVTSYQAPDGEIFPTLELAQKHEIEAAMPIDGTGFTRGGIADFIYENREKLITCLKQKERKSVTATPTPRKKRTPKDKAAPADPAKT